ncbi:MAG: choice-of-anchor Q domain-containing protein [Gemmataceae bacterium]
MRPSLEALEQRITPTTYNVTPNGTGVNSLAGAIAQANSDSTADTIVLAQGQYNLTAQLRVNTTQRLIIEGDGSSVIDLGGKARAFDIVGSGPVVFQQLMIQHGYASDDGSGNANTNAEGGGILANNGSDITLSNVVLMSNSAASNSSGNGLGGGIYVQGGSLSINYSVFENNRASGTMVSGKPGTSADGGGVYFDSPNAHLSMNYSALDNNTAIGGSGNPASGSGSATDGGDAEGGGLDVVNAQGVRIFASTLSNNTAEGGIGGGNGGSASGGGAELTGSVSLVNSTIGDNAATYGQGSYNASGPPSTGGGLDIKKGATVTLISDTVAYNRANSAADDAASDQGGGINNQGGSVTLTDTLVALNSSPVYPDFSGTVISGGHNLIGDATGSNGFLNSKGDLLGNHTDPVNPGLAPQLGNNGGPTQTIALLPGSVAIGHGDPSPQVLAATGPWDQRGSDPIEDYAREYNGVMDIGAYEYTRQDLYPPSPPGGGGGSSAGGTAPTPPSMFQAWITLYIDGIYFQIDSLLNQSTAGVQASIDANMPYAGPFGSLFELAGRLAVLQAVQ